MVELPIAGLTKNIENRNTSGLMFLFVISVDISTLCLTIIGLVNLNNKHLSRVKTNQNILR